MEQDGKIEELTSTAKMSNVEVLQKIFALTAFAKNQQNRYVRPSKHSKARALRAISKAKKAK